MESPGRHSGFGRWTDQRQNAMLGGTPMPSTRTYRFDDIILDAAAMRLLRCGQEVALEPKLFRLLEFLIENQERVLGKEEIFRVVWDATAVSDNALTRAVAQIRKVLEDDPKSPRYIETVPTVGYRFIGTLIPEGTEERPPPRSRRPAALWVGLLIAVAVAFAIWHIATGRHQRERDAAQSSAPIPLTSYRGSEDAPSFSPDGSQVAFEWNGPKQDRFEIYVTVPGSDATPLKITNNTAPDRWPSWSPDGRAIAFQRIVAPGKSELILIPALGGPERKLAEFPISIDWRGSRPEWSPDSQWIIVPAVIGQRTALSRISVETGESTQITDPSESLEDADPAISPDGKTLLFIRHPAYNWGFLYSVALDSETKPIEAPHRVPSGGKWIMEVRWKADGSEILARTPTGTIRMPPIGMDNPQIATWLGAGLNWTDLSRRGNRIAFSMVHGDANIWRIDLKDKILHPELFIASTARDVYPEYSPDGRTLAFHSSRMGGGSQVWIADSEGKRERQITSAHNGLTATPHWSPDGKTLAVDSNSSGIFQVYTLSAEGGKMKQLTNGPLASFGATWSHDGRWLYFTSTSTGRDEIWKMPSGGGPGVQITRNGGLMAVESTDGKTLFFCKQVETGSIWKIPVEGGKEEQLTDSLYRTNFALTASGIYYMTAAEYDGTATLKLYNFASRTSTTIQRIGLPEYGLDVSPDGRYLLYDQLDDAASDLMLVENFR
jgi:Tol biopolymer transport system component/DNA-binding winged helix-turn-helix (wHTH) protein